MSEVERLLRGALVPVEPPVDLAERMERRLTAMTDAAVDELARILEGVRELPDDRREALIMRFALGMDNGEIARAMGRSGGATKVLIHRAIRQLEEIVNVRQAGRR